MIMLTLAGYQAISRQSAGSKPRDDGPYLLKEGLGGNKARGRGRVVESTYKAFTKVQRDILNGNSRSNAQATFSGILLTNRY